MAPDRPGKNDIDRCFDPFYWAHWHGWAHGQGLAAPLDYDEQLEEHWRRGTLLPCIERIDGLMHDRGLTQKAIALAVNYDRSAITKLLNDHEGGVGLIRQIFERFAIRPPPERDRRLAGHCQAMRYVQAQVLGQDPCGQVLRPEEFAALYYLFQGPAWAAVQKAVAQARKAAPSLLADALRMRRQRAGDIWRAVRGYLGRRPGGPETDEALGDLMTTWGDAYLLYVPDIDPEWECGW